MSTVTKITIADELRAKAPSLKLGVVSAEVQVDEKDASLWDELTSLKREQARAIGTMDDLVKVPQIDAARTVFRACGKKPQRYRVSSEALLRRLLQGKDLYQVNNIVDINNLVSLKSLHSVGSYDTSRMSGSLVMRIGRDGEAYTAIGKQQTEVSGLPIFSDDEGPTGSPWSDSIRTMITSETVHVTMIVIDFLGEDDSTIRSHLEFAKSRLERYAQATNVVLHIAR